MKKLEISITKAQLVGFNVEAKDNKPEVTATLALLTAGGKRITTYTIATDSWSGDSKFELPLEAMPHVGELARILEAVAVRHCRDSQLALPPPKPKTSGKGTADVAVSEPAVTDAAINLDDIPF